MSVLREAFVDELKDLLDAERQLLKALPKMAEAAENDQLRAAFEQHEEETRQQISRLGQAFEAFEEEAKGKHCKGMEGLIEEAEELIEEEEGDALSITKFQLMGRCRRGRLRWAGAGGAGSEADDGGGEGDRQEIDGDCADGG
jgi:ferritin-like metal-binding protein YciE